MGTIYQRGRFWWLGFAGPGGKWVYRSSKVPSSEPRATAEKVLAEVEKALHSDRQRELHGKLTVAEWAVEWTKQRKARGVWSAKDGFRRLELHALPRIGHLQLRNVRPVHVRQLVAQLRADPALAARSVLCIYGLVHRLFADAVADELLPSTPCLLRRGDLPKKTDKDPTWRAGARFSRAEVEQLITDPRVPLQRRAYYALGFLTGMREGEAAALRWRSYDVDRRPLGALIIAASYTRKNKVEKSTKTGQPRVVPVHPVLAELLRAWRAHGFAHLFGRAPKPDDLLVPNQAGRYVTDHNVLSWLETDLKMLGLRHRRWHDARRTMISIGRGDGATDAVLRSLTHDRKGDQYDEYTSFDWETCCRAILSLQVRGGPVGGPPRIRAVAASKNVGTSFTTIGGTVDGSAHTDSAISNARGEIRTLPFRAPIVSSRVVPGVYGRLKATIGAGKEGKRRNVGRDELVDEVAGALERHEIHQDRDAFARQVDAALAKIGGRR